MYSHSFATWPDVNTLLPSFTQVNNAYNTLLKTISKLSV